MLVYERTIRDRNPEIRAAGKQIPRGPGARECLLHSRGDQPPTPERVRRFRGVTWPEAGQMRVLHSQRGADRTETEEEGGGIRHGVQTKDSLAARDLVNPLLKTRYQQMVLDQQESVYNSKRKAPLGSSHNQSPGLPQSVNSQTTFGLTTVKDESASSIVSPPKSQPEIEDEYQKGRELYRKSHNAWEVGEMVDRDYDWSKFTKESLYGVPTPHDNSGSQVRDALHWLHEAQSAKKAQIVTKRMDNFRERTQPQLGKVHDPIAETLDVDKDHSFGVMVTPDELNAGELMQMEGPSTYLQCQGFDPGVLASIRHHLQKNNFYNFDSLMHALEHHDKTLDVDKDHSFGVMVTPDELNAGELMQMEGPSTYLQCQGFDPGVLASIRHHLQKSNFYNFDSLMHALEHHDKEGAGQVSPEVVRQLCFQFDLPLTPDMLELLMVWCGEGEGVRYREMVQLVNWKTQPPQELLHKISEQNSDENPPGNKETKGTLPPPPSASLSNYRTCSQMIQATVGAIPTQNYRSYGVPTIRSELPAPRIRRVGDHTNYGDESDAYGLIYPSVYSNRGVYEEDFFSTRNPEEVRQIFERIGVSMNPETFQELWREAARRDPKGLVSVESFRAILEEVQAKQMEKQQTSC